MAKKVQPLDQDLKKRLEEIANTIRGLSIDAVEKANSGHPGMPLGCAEIAAYLYGYAKKHNPKQPSWLNRDRFILSGGHGSMLLYSSLHLAGFNLDLEQLKQFRQLHSQTPGHPERQETDGVETTTGPLGQGTGNAVGKALGLKMLSARLNTDDYKIIDCKVFALMTDGCMMEGATSEVSAIAGHLKLDNLIVIYDSNQITLDGSLDQSSSEDTKKRYEAYGWDVLEINGNDLEEIHEAISSVRAAQTKPVLIIAKTVIGKGSPNKAGTHKVHGSPLGPEEAKATKEALGIPLEPFYVPQSVREYFIEKLKKDEEGEQKWNQKVDEWAKADPKRYQLFKDLKNHALPDNLEQTLRELEIKSPISGRKASHAVIQQLAKLFPYLIGGSADLSGSDMTMIEGSELIAPGKFSGRNIKFGVREFGMATIATGLTQAGMFTPFIGTFLTFSDYMRNAMRLCSLMKEKVIYHFTHDSIFLGEDGPTHQPVEHYAALRAMPNLQFIRPADANEVKMAWIAALKYQGPTAFSLSRQDLPTLSETDVSYAEGMGRGAYIIKKEKERPDFTLVATGSEVSLALNVANALEKRGKDVRVISMPCWEIFEKQGNEYKDQVFGGDLGQRVSIEAGVDLGWHKYVGREGITICMNGFGASAPASRLAEEFGFTVESILERLL
ncbi:MAG: transketolase [Waddliaceae bacterium]